MSYIIYTFVQSKTMKFQNLTLRLFIGNLKIRFSLNFLNAQVFILEKQSKIRRCLRSLNSIHLFK